MRIIDLALKVILFFWLTAFGVGFADFAIQLQSEAIKAYQKGPISPSIFTRMMTGENKK